MYLIVKRASDMVISGAACIVLLPIFILLAILIRLESTGPAIFKQERIGRGGGSFILFKFRSMVKDAPNLGPAYTSAEDPRITQFGRFIRTTSLDELPQLWNVLIGDMSLIGPRPALASQRELYPGDSWELRNRVRPGITGLAQVNGRSALSLQEQLRWDLVYAAHPTWKLDVSIAAQTVWIVVRGIGVN